MNLFQTGDFTLHSGKQSNFKIDCDALTDEDWQALAKLIYNAVGRFGKVVGVPTGGLKLAKALEPYCSVTHTSPVLIVDDVLTTGGSMNELRNKLRSEHGRSIIGIVVFARNWCPHWITPIFEMTLKETK